VSNLGIVQTRNLPESGEQLTLLEKREWKSDRVLESILNKDKTQLKSLLLDYREVSYREIDALFDSIDEKWGTLSKSNLTEEKVTLNKGDFDFIYHLQLTTTHFGNWYMFVNEETETYLKLGVTFNKETDKIGGLVIALVPM